MKLASPVAILLLPALGACGEPVAPGEGDPAAMPEISSAMAPAPLAASGTFTQTGINGINVTTAGPNTIIEQTSTGLLSGTLDGTFQDELRVVIHPNGHFNTRFTAVCECTVDGRQGTIEMVLQDDGQLTSPDVAAFSGTGTITDATGDLEGLHGVLTIDGTIDIPSGLATYAYSGTIRFIQ